MRRDGGKMDIKLILKKYLSIVIVFLAIYSIFLLIALFNNNAFANYFNPSFFIILLISISLRLQDDYKDYEIDKENNRVIFNKKILLIAFISSLVLALVISIFTKRYLFIIPLVIMVLIFFLKQKQFLNALKVTVLPSLLICLTISEFITNGFMMIFIALSFFASMLFVRLKHGKTKQCI